MELTNLPDRGSVEELYWATHRLCIGHPLFYETRGVISAVGAVSPEDLPNVIKGSASPHLIDVRWKWAAKRLWKNRENMPLQDALEK